MMGSIRNERFDEYIVEEHPLHEPRSLRVISIGAGATGLNIAYQISRHMKNVEFCCYEKNSDIGGTWLENRYPGVGCDIPSHVYQFTWSPNPEWSEFYASGLEILQYFKNTAKKFDLLKYIKTNCEVFRAEWFEGDGIWKIRVRNKLNGEEFDDWCHFLVNAGGFLNHWRWPKIPGLQAFKGELLHSAAWDEKTNLTSKSVAVIGNGSSGIQIVTALRPVVSHLSVLIRNPTWVSTSYAQQFAGPNGANFRYNNDQKDKFKLNKKAYLEYCKAIETDLNGRFTLNLAGSKDQRLAVQYLTHMMKERLGEGYPNPERLIPNFEVGCRRPTPGYGYLEALAQANVLLTDTPIDSVEDTGIRLKSGEILEVDAIVCATGFDTSWRPRFPIIGRGDINLQDQWKERPTAYLSFAVPNFPNYFVSLGPNSPLTHGSALTSIEHLTKYLLRILYKLQTQNYKACEPLAEAVDDFVQHSDTFLRRTVWAGKCNSWMKGGKDTGAPLTHPGSRLHWFEMTREPRWEDWSWTRTSRNRFAYLGNGFSSSDLDENADKAWYLNDADLGLSSIQY